MRNTKSQIQPTVGIIDYNVGNIYNIARALTYIGAKVILIDSADQAPPVSHLLLPGVGAFGSAVQALEERCLTELIKNFANSGQPLLGICLGMQLLFNESEESPNFQGLGIIKGKVKALKDPALSWPQDLKTPHFGWNKVYTELEEPEIKNTLERNFYFVHSYKVVPETDQTIIGSTPFGDQQFPSIVSQDNILASQFHPELSAKAGLAFLRLFLEQT
jgi:glutamine amidotransferase